jgi:hypothetical protein
MGGKMVALEAVRGGVNQWDVTLCNSDGTPVKITGCTIRMTVRLNQPLNEVDDTDASIQVSTTTSASGSILITNPTGGGFRVTLASASTQSLKPAKYFFDLQVKDVSGAVHYVASGILDLGNNITRTL